MGTYYMIVCHELAQRIEPGDINHGGIKIGNIILGPVMKIVAAYAIAGEWSGYNFKIVGDYSDEYEFAEEKYIDVTEFAIRNFNMNWATRNNEKYKWTGKPEDTSKRIKFVVLDGGCIPHQDDGMVINYKTREYVLTRDLGTLDSPILLRIMNGFRLVTNGYKAYLSVGSRGKILSDNSLKGDVVFIG